MNLEDLERELYRRPLAHEGMTLFQEGRARDALTVAFRVVSELRAEGNDGLVALALLDVAHCLDGTGDRESQLPILLDAVKHARRYGNHDLLIRAEIWHIDLVMKTGSYIEAVQLLNALLRKRNTWKNEFNENLLFGRLGQAYLGLSRFDYATQCFNELLRRATSVSGNWQDTEHAHCGLATALCNPLWTDFENLIFRSHLPSQECFERNMPTLVEIERLLSADRGKQMPAALHLTLELASARLAVLRGDLADAEQTAVAAWQLGSKILPTFSATRRLRHVQSILHLIDQHPDKALDQLQFHWNSVVSDLETDLEINAHEIAAAAHTKLGEYRLALRHFEHIQELTRNQGERNLAPVEAPFFRSGNVANTGSEQELPATTKHSTVVSAALGAIDADLTRKFTAVTLAELIGVSERRLRYALREELGCTLVQAVTRRRLTRARMLLLANRQKNRSIRHIAEEVGLARMGSFIKSYREMFGELPSETLRRIG